MPPPAACTHDGVLLCLAFEDADNPGLDHSPTAQRVAANGVDSVPRQDLKADELAAELDLASLVILTDNAAFDLQAPMSLDLWFFYTEFTDSQRILIDNNLQYTVFLQPDADAVQCQWLVKNNSGLDGAFAPATITRPNEWHHVACTYDGTTALAYIDGQVSPSVGTRAGELIEDPLPPRIGQAGNANDPRLYVGKLDNVRVWTRLLDASEIALFAAGIEEEP